MTYKRNKQPSTRHPHQQNSTTRDLRNNPTNKAANDIILLTPAEAASFEADLHHLLQLLEENTNERNE